MQKLTLKELRERKDWSEAVIVFKQTNFFKQECTEIERSYEITSDAKYFDSSKIGTSLFGDCLDGTEKAIRLDWWLGDGAKVDYCYIIKGVNGNEIAD